MSVRERLIINFHGIGEPSEEVPTDERPYWCPSANWPAFADAMADVAQHASVRLEITFDDGNLSDVHEGLPLLLERGLMATFHVCAGRLGRPGYLAESDLVELRRLGMAIGSHGWDHVDLRRLGRAALDHEARDSQARLSDASGGPVTEFAVPFGSYDRRVLSSLRGYRTVYTSDRVKAQPASWLTPRMSYVRGWRPSDLVRFATERQTLGVRMRQRAIGFAKRWR